MDVEILESKSVNPSLLEAWWQLFDSVPDTHFYHHPNWHQSIATHLMPGDLSLAFLSDNGQLQMVLPLNSSAAERHRVHPAHNHLSLNDVLIHPALSNDSDKLLEAIRLTLDKPGTGWWDWRISNLANNSALIQALRAAPGAFSEINSTTDNAQIIGADNTTNWLLKPTRQSASFECTGEQRAPTGKLRRNLRRLRKQMREIGEIRIDTVIKPEQLPSAYDNFLAIEASGWKGAGDNASAISANAQLRAFYHSLLTPSMAGIEPQINLLWCNDSCVAAQFGIRTGTVLHLLKIGYMEEYARFSPGYLLLESILDNAANRNIKTLSLVTSPAWADRWHPEKAPVWQLNHYNSSPVGSALHKFDGLKQVIKSRLKQAA